MKRVVMAGLMAASALGLAGEAMAKENPWMVRGRVIGVLPDEGASLSVGNTGLPGTVDISDQYVPELDITYFFTKNIAAELILGVTPHDVKATGVTVPGVLDGATVDLGDVWLLPPTLTLQYHFDTGSAFKPYVGAGVNATFFFNEDEGPVADNIDYDPTVGFAHPLSGTGRFRRSVSPIDRLELTRQRQWAGALDDPHRTLRFRKKLRFDRRGVVSDLRRFEGRASRESGRGEEDRHGGFVQAKCLYHWADSRDQLMALTKMPSGFLRRRSASRGCCRTMVRMAVQRSVAASCPLA